MIFPKILGHFCLIVYYFVFYSPHFATCQKLGNVYVDFYPYVSILDEVSSQKDMNLMPMVATVVSRFSKVTVPMIVDFYPDYDYINLHSVLSFATYNKMNPGSYPTEVVLKANFLSSGSDSIFNKTKLLEWIVTEANGIFNNTVTTILFGFSDLADYSEEIGNKSHHQKVNGSWLFPNTQVRWGLVLEDLDCINVDIPKNANFLESLLPDIVLLHSSNSYLQTSFWDNQCTPYINNIKNVQLGYSVSSTDTYSYNNISMSRLVEQWHTWEQFANENNVPVFITGAFDIPTGQVYGGWWRLVENSQYSSSSDYVFQAKEDIAKDFDLRANSVNRTLLKSIENNLTRDHHGIIFNLFEPHVRQQTLIGRDDDIKEILQILEKSYDTLVAYVENTLSFGTLLKQINFTANLEKRFEIMLIDNSGSDLTQAFPQPQEDFYDQIFHRVSAFLLSAPVSADFQYIQNQTQYLKTTVLKNVNSSDYKFGYIMKLSLCLDTDVIEIKLNISSLLRESNITIFTFVESDRVKFGEERMIEQRILELEVCKRKFENELVPNASVQLGFALLYYDYPSDSFNDTIALNNFVLYWEKLMKWATKSGVLVIASNTVDGIRSLKEPLPKVSDVQQRVALGWWNRELTTNDSDDGSCTLKWTDRKSHLLKITAPKPPPDVPEQPLLNMAQIVVIAAGISCVAIIIVGVSIFMIARRHYQHKFLSRDEIQEFFDGIQNILLSNDNEKNGYGMMCKLPYDKNRFEIESNNFTIYHDAMLGSGEFGMVCQGKVEKDDGSVLNVAVKMVNSAKFHKATLTGLLSEIKVLAYLGKHDNVIELIGANTEKLKRGKVFVFLELGQCGSLRQHLRNTCPQTNPEDDFRLKEEMKIVDGNVYVNAEAEHSVILDPSLSDDLYRWSREICNGMSFLASRHVVHADLATRNVLLSLHKTAKICDFGLSRRMYNYADYVKQHQDPVPWKWMPPESLRRMEFNEKSDVWAYGVTLWEIYSLGDTPYPGLSWDVNFPRILEQGFRMSRPKYHERDMYTLMMDCWKTNPDTRPKFADLLTRFENEVLHYFPPYVNINI